MDWHRRHQRPLRAAGENRETVSRGVGGTAWKRRGGAAYPRERAGTELPCRLRPLSATGQDAGTGDVSEGALQDHRYRPDGLLRGQREPHGRGHGDEIASPPQLRGRHPYR